MSDEENKDMIPKQTRPLIEWGFGIVSATLVAILALFLGYETILGTNGPAELRATLDSIERRGDVMVLNISVRNQGGEAASAVKVVAMPTEAVSPASPHDIEFDFIAPGAVRRGALIFPEPVTSVRIEVEGFVAP